jgi:lysozyme
MPARVYEVKKPNMTGADIETWHKTVIRLFKTMGIVPPLEVNNKYTANLRDVSQALATAVGLDYKKMFEKGLGPVERHEIKHAANKKPTAEETKFRNSLKKRKGWKAVASPKPTGQSSSAVLNGYDVSSNQPAGVTASVKGDFAIVKATEGLTYVNPVFTLQFSGAKHSGKLLGLYHFGVGDDPEHEAQHFFNTVRPYVGQALMVLDFEGPAVSHGPAWAKAFLDHFHTLSGIKCAFYGSEGIICLPSYAAVAKVYPLWVAAYPTMNIQNGYNPGIAKVATAPWGSALIRQYSSTGRLSGYSGNLDLDVFYGNADLWRSLCKKS